MLLDFGDEFQDDVPGQEGGEERDGQIDRDGTIGRHDLKIYTNRVLRAFVFVLLGVLAACAPNPNGQGVTDTGTVVGTVVDASNPTQPIGAATIQIGLQVERLSPADNGRFTLNNVPTGTAFTPELLFKPRS